jgi:hypothetical protein
MRKPLLEFLGTGKMGPNAYTNGVVKRMFIATADQNYATARWAHMNAQDIDFFWLGLHAAEKYLKAILLMNGRHAKGYGHDIVKLCNAVRSIDADIDLGTFEKPLPVDDRAWREQSLDDFVKQLNEYGDANNRYMLYGYTISTDHLLKLDQFIYAIRRYCRPLRQVLKKTDGSESTINWAQQLKSARDHWKIGGDTPLERAANGKGSDELRRAFFNNNFAFAPNYAHSDQHIRHAASNPPLAEWFMRLQGERADLQTRETAEDTMRWVLENIQLGKEDKKIIKDALAAPPPEQSD